MYLSILFISYRWLNLSLVSYFLPSFNIILYVWSSFFTSFLPLSRSFLSFWFCCNSSFPCKLSSSIVCWNLLLLTSFRSFLSLIDTIGLLLPYISSFRRQTLNASDEVLLNCRNLGILSISSHKVSFDDLIFLLIMIRSDCQLVNFIFSYIIFFNQIIDVFTKLVYKVLFVLNVFFDHFILRL